MLIEENIQPVEYVYALKTQEDFSPEILQYSEGHVTICAGGGG
jgi:hypothetical protein